MDNAIKRYADSIYEQSVRASARTLNDKMIGLLNTIASRNPTTSLPFSGVDFQSLRQLYVQHVERCMEARLESYRESYNAAGRVPTDNEFREVWTNIEDAKKNQLAHSTRALCAFAGSRGMPGIPGDLLPHCGRGHDQVLGAWKIWRDKAHLPVTSVVSVADDHKFAQIAIQEARLSVAEDDRVHPRVGVVVVKEGEILAKAHRGESPEGHAEFVALEKKLLDSSISGATVYTTLEPCTTRNHPKIPCADRLVERKVRRVVIGMLDPNPNIRGLGQMKLRSANIATDFFPHELMSQVEELNRDFSRQFESTGNATPAMQQHDYSNMPGATQNTDEKPNARVGFGSHATDHNIRFVETRSIHAHNDPINGQIYESPQKLGDFQVSAVCFRNEPAIGQKVKTPRVKAHIIYRGESGEITDAPRGVWLEAYQDAAVFDIGQKHCVIVFLLSSQCTLKKVWKEPYTSATSWMAGGPLFQTRDGGISGVVTSVVISLLTADVCIARAEFQVKPQAPSELPILTLKSFVVS